MEPTFAVHGDLPLSSVGKIIQIREEYLSADDFPPERVRLLTPDAGGDNNTINGGGIAMDAAVEDNGAEDPYSAPARMLTIERCASDDPCSLDTVCHSYTLNSVPLVVTYLESMSSPCLAEDAAILSFFSEGRDGYNPAGGRNSSVVGPSYGANDGVSMSSSAASQLSRIQFQRRVVPLMTENALLREALGLPRYGPVTEAQIAAAARGGGAAPGLYAVRSGTLKPISSSGSRQDGGMKATGAGASPDPVGVGEPDSQQQQRDAAANSPDPFGVHSPYLWEQETAAARNARTKYTPFRDSGKKGDRGVQKLDQVTQQHLVCRLHDKSLESILEFRKVAQDRQGGAGSASSQFHESRALTQEEQSNLGTRLHDQQRAKKQQMMDELDRKIHPPTERRVFTQKDIDISNQRIYREPMEKKQRGMEKLVRQYVLDEDAKIPRKKLSKPQQEAMANRLSAISKS